MEPLDRIVVRGARTHNLQSVDVDIPRNRFVVVTGPSGSGKSSLAFNTIYAEGRRRYVESLSVYARQLLGPLARPEVDLIDGLSPAIAIEQRTLARNPRSTVGTVTEIDDYLRLLLSRAGVAHCPSCGAVINAFTVRQIVDAVMALGVGTRVSLLAPMVRAVRGTHEQALAGWRRDGFVRVRIDGEVRELGEDLALDAGKAHDLDLVIDRVALKEGVRARVLEAVELSLKLAAGLVRVVPVEGPELLLSERFACPTCNVTLPVIEPQLFSFNSPKGACTACHGLGVRTVADESRLVPDPSLSLKQGALTPFKKSLPRELENYARALGVDLHAPWEQLPRRARDELLYGDGDSYPGVLALVEQRARARRREQDDDADDTEDSLEERFRVEQSCDVCKGTRLRAEALVVTLGGHHIASLSTMPTRELGSVMTRVEAGLDARSRPVVERVLREIHARLGFLDAVGLPYLTLSRPAATLSGGEGQRVRLATQIGSALVGVLYVLDEPSVGLHPRDSDRLLTTLRSLVDRGNSVLVVEHDLDTIRAADYVVDMGPGAGAEGGRIVGVGTPDELAKQDGSVTGPFLSGKKSIPTPKTRRAGRGWLAVHGAQLHNLHDVSMRLPVGTLVAITGVSGSGKSSLLLGTLLPALKAVLARGSIESLSLRKLEGAEHFERVVAVDAAPIGRTPRSSPATYTGILTALRELFAGVPESRARGFKPGRFSFNVKGGRCESCQGEGVLRVEMHFLPDVLVPCEACGGRRYERETLEIKYRGFSIADILEMSVEQAQPHFEAIPKIHDALGSLRNVGLGYLRLGQPASTLSGGEAQRVKLARELARRSTGRTLYVLDEPTRGLHLRDTIVLLELLEQLVEQGNTVVVIEHQMDLVKCADWVVDIGPEGGDAGGKLVAEGTPEQVAAVKASYTGQSLKTVLSGDAKARGASRQKAGRKAKER